MFKMRVFRKLREIEYFNEYNYFLIFNFCMDKYSKIDLEEALRAINSIIQKCEKAQEKFPNSTSHHTLLKNRLKAMYISKALIEQKCI